MKRCPMCSSNAWSDTTFGRQTCPNCRSAFKLTQNGIKPDVSFRQLRDRPKANRDSVIVAGKVLCACCRAPFDLADTIDGELSTDGTRRINVQIGWTLRGTDFVPAFQERVIPRKVRGLICVTCMTYGNGRQVGRVNPSGGIMARPFQTERAESLTSDIKGNGYKRERDPEPNWAHSKDPSWLSATGYVPSFEFSDRWVFLRSFYRGPLASMRAVTGVKPLHVYPFSERPYRSPNAVARRVTSYRERIGRSLTVTDTLANIVRACIAAGNADAAAVYTRLALRHPSARRLRHE